MSESVTVTATGHRTWRMPQARVLVNGTERPETGLEQFTLTRTRYSRADTLDLSFALDRTKIPASGLSHWPAPSLSNHLRRTSNTPPGSAACCPSLSHEQ